MTVILTMLRKVEPETETAEETVTRITPHTRRLYHVTVPASKYDLIKSIADLLVGESTSREYLDAARERCARIALAAVVDAVIGSRPKTGRRQ